MPLIVLSALLIAFWIEPPAHPSAPDLARSISIALTGPLLVGLLAFAIGRGVAWGVDRRGSTSPGARRRYGWLVRLVDGLILLSFAVAIHEGRWPAAVRAAFGGGDPILVDDALVLAPFLLSLVAAWWGLYPGERALRPGRTRGGLRRYLILSARQSLGLVLPVALAFDLGQDLLQRAWPGADREPLVQVALIAGMGTGILLLAPALVRLTFPSQSLPAGPLRDRLERLARRCRFRCTDILVWDTGGTLVNAGVTGALPWFRYVLMTDAMVDLLDEREVEAVFGHEIGHVAHRHLPFFGLFFLGSLAVLALVADAVATHLGAGSKLLAGLTDPTAVQLAQGGVALLGVLAYFLVVFGFLSRRFERQADVFGCRAVSCGRPGCPPHADRGARADAPARDRHRDADTSDELCPVGIRIFANALSNVADLNGMAPKARSWRHGSIRRRIAFLEGLEGRPEAERRFQSRIVALRHGLAALLLLAAALAAYSGALRHLR